MGLQDSHNLGWKLALVLNGICNNDLLNSYECERRAIDDEILKFVNRTHSNISTISNNSAHTFVVSNIISIVGNSFPFIQDIIATRTTQLSYSYRDTCKYSSGPKSVDLIMDYWIRPSLVSLDIFNNVLKRRQQNITRVFRQNVTKSNLASGDRASNFHLGNVDEKEEDIDSSGFTLTEMYTLFRKYKFVILLFEGYLGFTERCYYNRDLNNIKQQIENEFGNNNICENFVKTIIIQKEDGYLNKLFGIHGQSLILIRSDHYIGLRSEPISIKALKYYFVKKLKVDKTRYEYNSDENRLEDESMLRSYSMDWLAIVALGTMVSMAGYALNKKYKWTNKLPKVRFSIQW